MEFKHPKYYKELRKRNRSFLLRKEECTLGKLGNNLDQAISDHPATAVRRVRPGPGLKPQATSDEQQASSDKPKETNSPDDKIQDHQASSNKPQAPSSKPQASSRKQQAAR